MTENMASFAYLISSVLFIMALRGLSSPETARSGNVFGIVGMIIAVGTTLVTPGVVSYWMILLGVLLGEQDLSLQVGPLDDVAVDKM